MSQLVLTLVLASLVLLLAIGGLSIGYLLTGKSKLHKRCGQVPGKKQDEDCGTKKDCPICSGEMNKRKDKEGK